jgi:flagellar protein FlgJ
MMFGVKDWDGINGNEQLVTTFEFNSNPNLTAKQVGLDSIDSITLDSIQSKKAGRPIYKYSGKAYFRKYDTPEQSFDDHCKIFSQKNFAEAMAVKSDTEKFVRAMAEKYAPGNNTYADILLSIIKTLKADK